MQIRLAGIVPESIVDGPGIRYTIFTQGCPHNCKGCHNQHTHNPDGGKIYDTEFILSEIKKNPLLSGVTFSGGEPFFQPKQLCYMTEKLKNDNYHTIIYTGYTFEQLVKMSESNKDIYKILSLADVLVDGKFIEEQKDISLKFKGSANQRIIDCAESFRAHKIIEAIF